MNVDLNALVEAAVVRPGDTLILRCTRITNDEAAHLKSEVAMRLPGVDVLVLGVDDMAVFHPEATR